MICSPADVGESFIGLLAGGFGFEGGRLKMFERRRACMRRRMKVIGFLEFLALGIHEFALKLILHQVHFSFHFRLDFRVLPMPVFYENRL